MNTSILTYLALMPSLFFHISFGQVDSRENPFILQNVMVNVIENGILDKDAFEIWYIRGEIDSKEQPNPRLWSVIAVRFGWDSKPTSLLDSVTYVSVIEQPVASITKQAEHTYALNLHGRANVVELILRVNEQYDTIVDFYASVLFIGERSQVRREFVPETRWQKAIPPINNPSLRMKSQLR